MSFFKKLFGGGGAGKAEPAAEMEHEGFHIAAAPIADGGQFRVSGTISRQVGGETKRHEFIRADVLPSRDAAVEMTFRKAKQIISEQGERLFR